MNKKLIYLLLMCLITTTSFAGFGRGGSGGFRSSGFTSSRSYSPPVRSYSSYSSPRQTVIREYHHTSTNSSQGNGMGIGTTIAASAAGSMIGNALTNHHNYTSPQPVYVNGQPQQMQQSIPSPQEQFQPMQNVQPIYQDQKIQSNNNSSAYLGIFLIIIILIFSIFIAIKLKRSF